MGCTTHISWNVDVAEGRRGGGEDWGSLREPSNLKKCSTLRPRSVDPASAACEDKPAPPACISDKRSAAWSELRAFGGTDTEPPWDRDAKAGRRWRGGLQAVEQRLKANNVQQGRQRTALFYTVARREGGANNAVDFLSCLCTRPTRASTI